MNTVVQTQIIELRTLYVFTFDIIWITLGQSAEILSMCVSCLSNVYAYWLFRNTNMNNNIIQICFKYDTLISYIGASLI